MRRSTFRPSFAADVRAVSEVVGQVLIFGILSIALVGALLGFNVAKENATERVIELRADATAQVIELRVREALDLVIMHQATGTDEFNYTFTIDLDDELEGYGFVVNLDADRVQVNVTALPYTATATIHERSSTLYEICDGTELSGGPITVRAHRIQDAADVPPGCSSVSIDEYAIFLESA